MTTRRQVGGFEPLYEGTPPWEIDRPQPALITLAEDGHLVDPILDVGCGTGENSLYLTSVGHSVVGIDGASTAVDRAQAKARQRGLPAQFLVADAFDLTALGRQFATVVDSAFLHTLPDAASRRAYTGQLAGVLRAGGQVHLLQIAESAPTQYPRLTRAQIVDAFNDRWSLHEVQHTAYAVTAGEVAAWLVTMTLANSADDPTVAKETDLAEHHDV